MLIISFTLGTKITMLDGEIARNFLMGFMNRAWKMLCGDVSDSPFLILLWSDAMKGPIYDGEVGL